MSPLRCHLLIGPPASGKSTLAMTLQELLSGSGSQPVVLSTDAIRKELYGNPAAQGSWNEIGVVLFDRLKRAVESDMPAIIDATHARRPWRLGITQQLELPRPVEWVGWWLRTPLEICQKWNKNNDRALQVSDDQLKQYYDDLKAGDFGPSDHEGFATLIELDPSSFSSDSLMHEISEILSGLPKRISGDRNHTSKYKLHRYSRLLDLERLFYLIRLLSRFPGLKATDDQSAQELRELYGTFPLSEDPAERAAGLLRHHGVCYADVEHLREDLAWLQQQGFMESISIRSEVIPPEADEKVKACLGCRPPSANSKVFVRIMTLIRHVLQNPLDHDRDAAHVEQIYIGGKQIGERGTRMPLNVHLVQQLKDVKGSYEAGRILRGKDRRWASGESQTLLKDLAKLKPYGLFPVRPARNGYALGTALLTMPRLLELHALVKQVADRLADPSAQDLLKDFTTRLQWAGYEIDDETPPVRAYANRSIVGRDYAPPGSLGVAQHAERLEEAILKGYRVELQQYEDAALFEGQSQAINTITAWPLQLLFHNIGWYLAYEEYWPDDKPGLITTQRLDRLHLRKVVTQVAPLGKEHRQQSWKRLERLLDYCGGIFFGRDRDAQLTLCSDDEDTRRSQLVKLRFRCEGWVFKFLREGVDRFPLECTRFSKPLPSDTWTHRKMINATLEPIEGDSHPYPVEFDLPGWTIGTGLKDGDVDLKRWLFGFDDGIVIEEPRAFLERRLRSAQEVLRVHGAYH
ncbi:AAA family ATPase [Synechococcus sp. CBW1108]|uniref:AAA family ATPase n=1 Tax=Synechococcus sp. CBW1108 TaxID=1353147 RepID=UPI0018CF2231|nr:AAA family ATPase [Synechococcus sp. CBW1108]QPN70105.1 AAA family ATPase [Synechococcus sp. CBW1108]